MALLPSCHRTATPAAAARLGRGLRGSRRLLRPLAGWSAGIGAYFLLIGLLAASMIDFLADNPRFADLAAQAGFAGLGQCSRLSATLFALLAIPVGAFAAVRLAAFAAAETDATAHPPVRPPDDPTRLLTAETVATLAAAAILITVASAATWLGTAIAGARLPLLAALAGTWNVLPVVLLCLGAAVAALGWRAPRRQRRRCATRRRRVPAEGRRRQHRRPHLGEQRCRRSPISPQYRTPGRTGGPRSPWLRSRSQPRRRAGTATSDATCGGRPLVAGRRGKPWAVTSHPVDDRVVRAFGS